MISADFKFFKVFIQEVFPSLLQILPPMISLKNVMKYLRCPAAIWHISHLDDMIPSVPDIYMMAETISFFLSPPLSFSLDRHFNQLL